MNELEIIDKKRVEDLIYVVRGVQVVLDSDLAMLYECVNGTKDINKAVKRNIERFPKDFYFQLTESEYLNLRFQIGTSSLNKHGGIRVMPHVFTEQGVAMLASILRTPVATQVSINIMRAFVIMRKFLVNGALENRVTNMEQKIINLDNHLQEYDKQIEKLFEKFPKEKNTHLFFDGKIYDAYSLLKDIFNKAKKEIIIIDNYIDKSLLDILREFNGNIIIYTKIISKQDVEKYRKQYHNVKIYITNDFHDRFIILDKEVLYHSGASFKDLGKKCFAINKLDSKEILYQLLEKIKH